MANTTSQSSGSPEQRSSPEYAADLAGKLSQGASDVTEQTIERVQRTRDRLEDELAHRRARFSERIREVSDVLDGAGRKLGDEDLVAEGLRYVSGKIDGVASYVESADPNRLAGDLRDAMRERPAWFFGGAFVLGLALGRFAKSSAEVGTQGASPSVGRRPAATGAQPATGGAGRIPEPSQAGVRAEQAGVRPAGSGSSPSGGLTAAAGIAREATTGVVRAPTAPPMTLGRKDGVREP